MKVNMQVIKKASKVLRALNHKMRHRMIELIDEKGSCGVTELYVAMRIEQSVCSQHLSILRNAGVVSTVRDGKRIIYSVDKERLRLVTEQSEAISGTQFPHI